MFAKPGKTKLGSVLGAMVMVSVGAGCYSSAHVHAVHAPIPVMVGPVPCIGCKPEPTGVSKPVAEVDQIEDDTYGRMSGYFVPAVYVIVYGHRFSQKPTALGPESARRVVDPCRDEVKVSEIKASAFSVFAWFFWTFGAGIDTTAAKRVRMNGTCSLESWPFSGPNGIFYPGQPSYVPPKVPFVPPPAVAPPARPPVSPAGAPEKPAGTPSQASGVQIGSMGQPQPATGLKPGETQR
jgi:hypothetical protein